MFVSHGTCVFATGRVCLSRDVLVCHETCVFVTERACLSWNVARKFRQLYFLTLISFEGKKFQTSISETVRASEKYMERVLYIFMFVIAKMLLRDLDLLFR